VRVPLGRFASTTIMLGQCEERRKKPVAMIDLMIMDRMMRREPARWSAIQ